MIVKFLNADYYHAKSKEKLIVNLLKSIHEGESILDLGAGEMPYRKYCEHLRYTSQDFCQYDGTGDGRGIQTNKFDTKGIDIVSDITKLPLPDNSQDNILCSKVLEHIKNPVDAINEMVRVLKPGGRALITVPSTSFLHFSPYHYYTGFKTNFFKEILPENGIDINSLHRVGSLYSVTALYVCYIADKFSKVFFSQKTIHII